MKKKLLIVMLTLIVAIASAFALTACGETNGNGNGDNTDNTTVVTPGGGNKDTDDNDNPEKPPTEGLKYELLDDDTYMVSDYNGTAIEVIIPSTYNGKPVTSIGEGTFSNCSSLKTIYCKCEESNKPDGWSEAWKGNCTATVVWGYKSK